VQNVSISIKNKKVLGKEVRNYPIAPTLSGFLEKTYDNKETYCDKKLIPSMI